jgi:hypothetical protein
MEVCPNLILPAQNFCHGCDATIWYFLGLLILFPKKFLSISYDTAEAMWNDLKDRFSQQNGPRIFQILKSISDLRQENLSVSNYFTILKGLWDELIHYKPLPPCTCGTMKVHNEYQQQEHVMQFLMGLNESYAHTRGQILMLNPLPPINIVFSLVIQ